MSLEIKTEKEFSEIYCPLRKIDKTFEKISTENCLKKCAYGVTGDVKNVEVFEGGKIIKKDIKLAPWRILCRVKEQQNLSKSIFDVYKR